ncbi:MAG: FAD-dependent monooxygenase [Flavobacteriales bacterium]|nr:FAD-dependent monooxygenase [Flavobacteriales bacterium]
MKIVIIGGGIAGLACAVAMKKIGHQVVVKEKYSLEAKSGMAFLIRSNTLNNIRSLSTTSLNITGHHIHQFLLLNSCGSIRNKIPLTGWCALQRITLVKFLVAQLTTTEFHENSGFSHFKYEGNQVIAAVFKDGSIESGDIFIGADGINSPVRESFCKAQFYPNEINDVLCLIKNGPRDSHNNTFRKFQSVKQGISFGLVPLPKNEHVWFTQFDSKLFAPLLDKNKDDISAFCSQLLAEFPEEVKGIVKNSDFKNAHLWISKELKLLDNYYKGNVCLIGDAAHGSISLTSSGVYSAISSAIDLAQALSSCKTIDLAFNKYEKARKTQHLKTIQYAQLLKTQFLSGHINTENYKLPFMK